MKDYIIGGIAVLALAVAFLNGGTTIIERPLGSGSISNVLHEFLGGFVVKDNYATTTPASATLSAREAAGFSTVSFYPSVGDVTLTLPASTTLGALLGSEAGAMKRVCYYNATTTAGIDITFASGTGVDLEVASSTTATAGIISLVINADNSGCIEFARKSSAVGAASDKDITARFIRFVDGD